MADSEPERVCEIDESEALERSDGDIGVNEHRVKSSLVLNVVHRRYCLVSLLILPSDGVEIGCRCSLLHL